MTQSSQATVGPERDHRLLLNAFSTRRNGEAEQRGENTSSKRRL